MIKLSNQQIAAIAKKIFQETIESSKQKLEEETLKIYQEHSKVLVEYIDAYNAFVTAAGKLEERVFNSYYLPRTPYKDNKSLIETIKSSIQANMDKKTPAISDIITEIHYLSIDAETLEQILEHFADKN